MSRSLKHIDIRNLSFLIGWRVSKLICQIPVTMIGTEIPSRLFPTMPEEMNDCLKEADSFELAKICTIDAPDVAADSTALSPLPTLQRNALRKIFDRQEFAPEEVAALGYRRLHQAEGIGQKGMSVITAWLGSYGFELKPPPLVGETGPQQPKKTRKNIAHAVRLLCTHGYIVEEAQAHGDAATGRAR